jgi:NAD(P)-dependent dehydrogenase (short-subunit alcohol dehydrogenase family)
LEKPDTFNLISPVAATGPGACGFGLEARPVSKNGSSYGASKGGVRSLTKQAAMLFLAPDKSRLVNAADIVMDGPLLSS